MSVGAGHYRATDLIAVARDWGYRSDIGAGEPSDQDGNDAILLHGSMRTTELSCGLRICASDLTAKRAHQRSGVLARSLSIMFPIAGEGDAYRLTGGKAAVLSPGACVAIRASDDVALSSAYRCGQRTCSLFLDACPARITDAALAERITRSLRSTVISQAGVDGLMQARLQRIHLPNATGVVGRLRLEACVLDLLASILDQEDRASADGGRADPRDAARIGRVRDYLIEHPEHDHSLGELAAFAGVSVSSLKRKFMSVTGQSVFDFLRDVRLERARFGLEQGGWTLKQAAWFAGYRHPTNFSAAYRRKFGVTPAKAGAV